MSEPPQHQIRLVVPRAKAARWLQVQIEAGRKLNAGNFLTSTRGKVNTAIDQGDQWLVVVRQALAVSSTDQTWRMSGVTSPS